MVGIMSDKEAPVASAPKEENLAVPSPDPDLGKHYPRLKGRCPSCGSDSLFRGHGGYVTCAVIGCKDPGAAYDMLSRESAAPVASEVVQLLFAELPIGDLFTFNHDGDGVRYRKSGQREYELAVPVAKRVGTRMAPVTRWPVASAPRETTCTSTSGGNAPAVTPTSSSRVGASSVESVGPEPSVPSARTVTRYSPDVGYGNSFEGMEIIEDGEWVPFEEVSILLSALAEQDEQIHALRKTIAWKERIIDEWTARAAKSKGDTQ